MIQYDVYAPSKGLGVQAFLPSAHPATIPKGGASKIVNMRWPDGLLRVRGGSAQVVSSIPNAVECVGAKHFPGAVGLVAAFRMSDSSVRIYRASGSSLTWTEISGSATRFSGGDRTSPVSFVTVTDPETGAEVLIVSRKGSHPRVWTPSQPMRIHEPIALPESATSQRLRFHWTPTLVAGGTGTMPTYATLVGGLSGSTVGTGKDRRIRISRDTSSGPATMTISWSAPADFRPASSVNFVIQTSDPTIFDRIQIDVVSPYRTIDGMYKTIHSADRTSPNRGDIIPIGPQTYVLQCPVAHLPLDSKEYDELLLTWVGDAPSSATSMDILCIGGGGPAKGDTVYASTLYSPETRAESPRVVYPPSVPPRLADMDGSDHGSISVPLSPLINFFATVRAAFDEGSFLVKHVTAMRIYRKDQGDDDLYLTQTVTFSTPFAAIRSVLDTVAPQNKVFRVWVPGPHYSCIPKCGPTSWANGRLVVAGQFAGTQESVYFSEIDQPFRFRDYSSFDDPVAPAKATFRDESVVAIFPTPAGTVGAHNVYVLTDVGVWACSGRDARNLQSPYRVSDRGCAAANAAALVDGSIYYLDQDRQIRVVGNGGTGTISNQVVDGITRRWTSAQFQNVSIAGSNQKVYVLFPNSSSTPSICDRMLVYDSQRARWESEDVPPVSFHLILSSLDPVWHQVAGVRANGAVWAYDDERYANDGGFPVSAVFETGWLGSDADGIVFGRGRMSGAAGAVSEIRFVRRYTPSGADAVSSPVSAGLLFDKTEPAAPTTGNTGGTAASLGFQWSAPANATVFFLSFEAAKRGQIRGSA